MLTQKVLQICKVQSENVIFDRFKSQIQRMVYVLQSHKISAYRFFSTHISEEKKKYVRT